MCRFPIICSNCSFSIPALAKFSTCFFLHDWVDISDWFKDFCLVSGDKKYSYSLWSRFYNPKHKLLALLFLSWKLQSMFAEVEFRQGHKNPLILWCRTVIIWFKFWRWSSISTNSHFLRVLRSLVSRFLRLFFNIKELVFKFKS